MARLPACRAGGRAGRGAGKEEGRAGYRDEEVEVDRKPRRDLAASAVRRKAAKRERERERVSESPL